MICRLLRHLILVVLLAGGLTACDQLFGSNNVAGITAPFRALGNSFRHMPATGQASPDAHTANGRSINADPPLDPPSLTTGSTGNFWNHLRADFQLPNADNQPQVQGQIQWFIHNQGYLNRTIRRAAPYMYFILEETQKRNLPGELVLLPIIESAYNPFVSSFRGAAGLWQLMPGTAYGLGIKQDWWFDGRRDIYASTNAALDYLTYLQSFFGGDWLLAIAAYDTGEGNIQNAVRRNSMEGRPTDFWSLSLYRETRSYVPRLLALSAIIRNPEHYGITLPPISDQPYLQQVDLGVPINLSQAAQLAGMSLVELKQLNPGYSRMTTDPNGPYKLLLPIDRIALFKEQLAALPSITHVTWGRYKVQSNDTLMSIAKRFHTTIATLRETNHIRGHVAPVGKIINVPTGTESVVPHIDTSTLKETNAHKNAVSTTTENATNDQQASVEEVLNGSSSAENTKETKISNETNKVPDLAAQAAALTTVPVAKRTATIAQKQIHVIKHGETLVSIARHYNVKVNDLLRWNKLKSNKLLKPGMRLIILKGIATHDTSVPAHQSVSKHKNRDAIIKTNERIQKKPLVAHHATNKRNKYVVRSGDTLSAIAKRNKVTLSDLRKWNHLPATAKLKPGQELLVFN